MEENVKKYGWKDEVVGRWNSFRWKVNETSKKAVKSVENWCVNNPEAVTGLIIAAAGAGFKIAKDSARNRAVKQDQDWKDRHIYDHSLGRYVELRRKLKSNEYAQVLERKERTGKSLSVVLDEMGYLR